MVSVFDVMDAFFYNSPEKGMVPPVSIFHNKDDNGEMCGVVIQMALSGFTKEDVTIEGNSRTLTIKGDNTAKEGVSVKFQQSFCRKWDLKDNLDINKMEGSLEDGLLTVTIPLKEASTSKVILSLK